MMTDVTIPIVPSIETTTYGHSSILLSRIEIRIRILNI